MLDMEIIADQISRAFRGESWHGPSVREVLAGVSAEDAAAHPIPGAHSIWEIVLHLTGGYNLGLLRFRGQVDYAFRLAFVSLVSYSMGLILPSVECRRVGL